MNDKGWKLICGVDDAGRGPVIGPMVLAGVAFYQDRLNLLGELGVRDSKMLRPEARLRIRNRIYEVADRIEVEVVKPSEIDKYVQRRRKLFKLNRLEAEKIASIISKIGPCIAYVDSPDIDADRFGKIIAEMLSEKVKIISEHHADKVYPIVSAASIVAKVRRDEEIEELKRTYGDFGSGYPSDPKTRAFLRKLLKDEGKIPEIVRRSWKTLRKL